jgi:hypothetical protein
MVRGLDERFSATTERLERIVRATLKRNAERPEVDFTVFDDARLCDKERAALGFFVRQVQYIEAVSPANLATLAQSTPIASLRSAYGAQMQDERAHAALLARYAALLPGNDDVRWESVVGCEAGKLLQREPYAGAVAVLTSIEFYATSLLDEVLARVEEPLLHALFKHILVDEARHKALAIEAVRVLEREGYGASRLSRARLAVARRMVDVYFENLLAPALARFAAPLSLRGKQVYERARDEIASELSGAS